MTRIICLIVILEDFAGEFLCHAKHEGVDGAVCIVIFGRKEGAILSTSFFNVRTPLVDTLRNCRHIATREVMAAEVVHIFLHRLLTIVDETP